MFKPSRMDPWGDAELSKVIGKHGALGQRSHIVGIIAAASVGCAACVSHSSDRCASVCFPYRM